MRRENQVYPMARVVPRPSVSQGWHGRWASFLNSHRGWWERQSSLGDPVYCLPGPVIDELCRSQPRLDRRPPRERILTEDEECGERDFTALCRWWAEWDQNVVGITGSGLPIRYPLLNDQLIRWRAGRTPTRTRGRNSWTSMFGKLHKIQLAVGQSQMVHAAWLIQQSEYWDGLTELKNRWRGIRDQVTFGEVTGSVAPLAALAIDARIGNGTSKKVSKFHEDMWEFARRWNIAGLTTWDLPIPQGPLLGVPMSVVSLCRCQDDSSAAFPGFIPPQRLFGDWKTVWQLPTPDPRRHSQTQSSRCSAKPCLQNQIPTYALVLRVFLAELAVRSRFNGTLPRGMFAPLCGGLAKELGRNADHIRRTRSSIQVAFGTAPGR